jgi:hypothetical protein
LRTVGVGDYLCSSDCQCVVNHLTTHRRAYLRGRDL